MAKLQLPFELQKPDASTFVTQATEVGHNGKSVSDVLDTLGSEMASTGNSNSGMIETKVNALLLCVKDLITKIVFHSGTPYQIPTELQSSLILKRYSGESSKAICGTCLCGEIICGQL